MTRSERWGWPSVIISSTIIIDIIVFADISSPARAVFAIWFLCICPGMALARLLRLPDTWSELTLALALSFTLGLSVNMFLVYAGWWSHTTGLATLSLVSVVGAILQLAWKPSDTPMQAVPLNNAPQRPNIKTLTIDSTTPQDAD